MSDQNPTEIRALTYVLHAMRPDWNRESVEATLAKDRRPFKVIAQIAVQAATDETAKTPGVIAHRAINPTTGTTAPLAPLPDPVDREEVARRQAATAKPETIAAALAESRAAIRAAKEKAVGNNFTTTKTQNLPGPLAEQAKTRRWQKQPYAYGDETLEERQARREAELPTTKSALDEKGEVAA